MPVDRADQPRRLTQVLGCLCVFASAFGFYLATATVKWSTSAGLAIDSALFVFARFISGFVVVCGILAVRRARPRVVRYDYLIGRTLANCVAVYCFFKAVEMTSVAEANILNMTYPLFIALISWFWFKQERDLAAIGMVGVAFLGVWLILSPSTLGFRIESLWGIGSGVSAAIAIIYLNLSRRVHDTETTLFFLFGVGAVIIALLFYRSFVIPNTAEMKYLALCAFFSVTAQYLLTLGFRFVTALEGGIISSTRILLAAMLGPVIASDPVLSPAGWLGAFLIFSANVYLTWRKAHPGGLKQPVQ